MTRLHGAGGDEVTAAAILIFAIAFAKEAERSSNLRAAAYPNEIDHDQFLDGSCCRDHRISGLTNRKSAAVVTLLRPQFRP